MFMFSVKAECSASGPSKSFTSKHIDKVIFCKCSRTITVIGYQLPVTSRVCMPLWTSFYTIPLNRIPSHLNEIVRLKRIQVKIVMTFILFLIETFFGIRIQYTNQCIDDRRLMWFENDFVICETWTLYKHITMLFVLMPSSLYSWFMTRYQIDLRAAVHREIDINKLNPMEGKKEIRKSHQWMNEWVNRSCFEWEHKSLKFPWNSCNK